MLRLTPVAENSSFCYNVMKAPHRYVVQEGDATVLPSASEPGPIILTRAVAAQVLNSAY